MFHIYDCDKHYDGRKPANALRKPLTLLLTAGEKPAWGGLEPSGTALVRGRALLKPRRLRLNRQANKHNEQLNIFHFQRSLEATSLTMSLAMKLSPSSPCPVTSALGLRVPTRSRGTGRGMGEIPLSYKWTLRAPWWVPRNSRTESVWGNDGQCFWPPRLCLTLEATYVKLMVLHQQRRTWSWKFMVKPALRF